MAVSSYGVFQEVGQLGGSVRHMLAPLPGQRQDYLQECVSVGIRCILMLPCLSAGRSSERH